jgi:hypothetical protein
LYNTVLTQQSAAALGAGLISTSSSQNHFKELRMTDMTFEDGAILELAAGLQQNSSLCVLRVHGSDIGDVELAQLVGAMESRSSLKELSLQMNRGQEHTMVALGKVLASKNCQLEELDFSGQCLDDSDGLLIGHIGILAQGLRWNESLRCLDLSWNGLLDKDIVHCDKFSRLVNSKNWT